MRHIDLGDAWLQFCELWFAWCPCGRSSKSIQDLVSGLLLAGWRDRGGDKSTQDRDITRAQSMVRELKE